MPGCSLVLIAIIASVDDNLEFPLVPMLCQLWECFRLAPPDLLHLWVFLEVLSVQREELGESVFLNEGTLKSCKPIGFKCICL